MITRGEEGAQLSAFIESNKEDGDRTVWSKKIEGMLSFLGLCVGLGNLWRFPYLCMRNGGGAFLIPFLLCLLFCGFPLFFLEVSLAQFTGKDALHTWEVCPIFRGIGHGMVIATFVMTFYYNANTAWIMFYLGNSFITPLPWRSCDNDWNTDFCVSSRSFNASESATNFTRGNLYDETRLTTANISYLQNSNVTFPDGQIKHKYITAEEEFWQYRTLEISKGIDVLGHIPWHLAVCFLAAWTLVTLCLIKGVKSMGKVVYLTATLPYVLLTVILIRASFLPGATDGMLFLLSPDFEKLGQPQVWVEAALQVFYSLCPAWGQLMTMASYNTFHNNCYRDSIILTILGEGTSIYGGFVVFAVIGYMAHDANLPIATVVKSGPGLGFAVYPEALAKLPLPNLWAVLFFLMLLCVALDSQFACVEMVIAAAMNHFQSLRKKQLVMTICVSMALFLLGLFFCTQAGIYVYQILDWYVAVSLPILGFIECIIFGWIYGAERFSKDVNMMLGRQIPVFVRICWCFINPIVLLVLFVFTFVSYEPPTYGDYVYPSYANIIGWLIGMLPIVPVVLVGIMTVLKTPGQSMFEKFKASFKPSPYWKPISKKHAMDYHSDNSTASLGLLEQMKLNILGK
ncbi:sodium- and chloride-dependent glycine transporter 2-like [Ylistrum balloti]|uniref:sodium- and chloride-dependent glycine transporter 2-like n=1 Tax=Ylistrum balloti TaxID=509963 RepID=UPI002905D4B2|nr:sodium- and chloride-dependent glycine transporter 2-like [Ylistrum balloti]